MLTVRLSSETIINKNQHVSIALSSVNMYASLRRHTKNNIFCAKT